MLPCYPEGRLRRRMIGMLVLEKLRRSSRKRRSWEGLKRPWLSTQLTRGVGGARRLRCQSLMGLHRYM